MTLPEVFDYLFEKVSAIVSEYDVACIEAGRHDEWISALLKAHGAAQPAA